MRPQRTVRGPIRLSGVGLHRGAPTELVIDPAPAGAGIVFIREDLSGFTVPALQQHRSGMVHASRLSREGVAIDTPEHLLAALFALGVDNAWLRLSGPEVPILDGSSLPFVHALIQTGLVDQSAPRGELIVVHPVVVEDEGRRLEIHPGEGLRLTAAIDFEHEHLGYQELTVRIDSAEDFLAKLAPARTFGMRRDVERLQAMGLARGGSEDNAIVVEDAGFRGAPLRFPDEFVRHKLLDLVGDLALLGCGLQGRVVAWRSGHSLHGRLVDALRADRSAWLFEGAGNGPPSAPTPPGVVRG
jgi:UDP-3-O-[3-hydroxymyristoyl] N-acetylglucosamine deacetylase